MADKLENAMDYQEHDKSYDLFIKIAKYLGIGTIAALILLAIITL